MTLIGAWLTEPGRAFVWCDDECYRLNGAPAGHIQKMAVNHEAEAVVVSMGDNLMIDIVAEVVPRYIIFDLLVDALAAWARQHWYPTKRGVESALALAVGYSHRCGRFVGYELPYFDKFQPRLITTMAAWPYCTEAENLFPREPADLLGVAQRQMLEIQKILPQAGISNLIVAKMRRGMIGVHRLSGAEGMLQRPLMTFEGATA